MSRSVLHVDTGREDRGGQRQVALLIRGLIGVGWRVGLAAPPEAPLWSRVGDLCTLERFAIPFRGEVGPSGLLGLRRASNGWGVIHAHTAHAITAAAFAVRGRGIPLIAHRRVSFPQKRHPLARWKRGWPEAWIAVSDSVAAVLRADGIAHERIVVIPSAVDPERLQLSGDLDQIRRRLGLGQDPLLLSVGELAAHKGHAELIRALSMLHPQVRLKIIGQGRERAELIGLAERCGVLDRVEFLGQLESIADWVVAADLFVFPSKSGEGSPAALKEAILLGTPVLASDIEPHREIGRGQIGLFPAGDPEALAAALQTRLDQREQCREAAAGLRHLAADFTPAALVAATAALYRRLA